MYDLKYYSGDNIVPEDGDGNENGDGGGTDGGKPA